MHFRDTSDDSGFNLQLTNPASSFTTGDVPDSGVSSVADGPPAPAGSTISAQGTTIVPAASTTGSTTTAGSNSSVWSTLTSAFQSAGSIFGTKPTTPVAQGGTNLLLPLLLVGGAVAAVVVLNGKKK